MAVCGTEGTRASLQISKLAWGVVVEAGYDVRGKLCGGGYSMLILLSDLSCSDHACLI